uniref:Uncharacterized protein n=1 Tax=viral metagenome TaxID=1070528 RepID=A0A6C0DQV6_9ZZZZ
MPEKIKNKSKYGHRRYSLRMQTTVGGKWSRKYKNSINCRKPHGFSQRQYCKYGRKHKKTQKNKNMFIL